MNDALLTRDRPRPSAPPGWRVSARHRSSIAITPAQPFGSWHARKVGATATACGLPAAGWPIFWHLSFARGGADVCVDCLEAVRTVAQRRVV